MYRVRTRSFVLIHSPCIRQKRFLFQAHYAGFKIHTEF